MTREEALEVIKSHPFLFASFPDDVIEALDVLIEQEPVLEKIRAEIESYKLSEDELSDMDEDSVKWGMKIASDIFDKHYGKGD